MSDYKFLNVNELNTHFAGDEEMVGELVDIFAGTYPDIVDELKASIVKEDFEVVERSAHSLKGMVANFFAEPIKENCLAIEKMGKEKSLSGVDEKVSLIESDIKTLLDELKDFLGQ